MNLVEQLYRTGKTVFSLRDLRVIWGESRPHVLRAKAKYYMRTGRLKPLKRGVYAFAEDYDCFELAQTLITPSYISLDSALRHHGLLFQFSTTITCIAQYTRTLHIDGRSYRYHKVRNDILSAPLGIDQKKRYMMALPERAYCDSAYLGYTPSIDESHAWDAELFHTLVELYGVPRVSRAVSLLLS